MYRNGNASDYLWSIDPSGQYQWGYAWDHCGGRPDNIYDVHGSGQCITDGVPTGEFKLYAREFVETARAPVYRTPQRAVGNGYVIRGSTTGDDIILGLVASSGHTVFKDDTPVALIPGYANRGIAPIDFRYDQWEHVWRLPYKVLPVVISAATSGLFGFNASGHLVQYANSTEKGQAKLGSNHYNFLCRPYNDPSREYPYRSLPHVFTLGYDQTEEDTQGQAQHETQVGDVVNASIDHREGYGSRHDFELYDPYEIIFTGSNLYSRADRFQPILNAHTGFETPHPVGLQINYFPRAAADQNHPWFQLKGASGLINLSFSDVLWRRNTQISTFITGSFVKPASFGGAQYDFIYYLSQIYATLLFYERVYRIQNPYASSPTAYGTPLKMISHHGVGNYYDITPSGEFLHEGAFFGNGVATRHVGDVEFGTGTTRNSISDTAFSVFKAIKTGSSDIIHDSLYLYGEFVRRGRHSIREINKKRFPHIDGFAQGELPIWFTAKYPGIWNRPNNGFWANNLAGYPPLPYKGSDDISIPYNTWLEPIESLGDLSHARNYLPTSGFWYHGPNSLSVLDRSMDELVVLNMQNPLWGARRSIAANAENLVISPTIQGLSNSTVTLNGSCSDGFTYNQTGGGPGLPGYNPGNGVTTRLFMTTMLSSFGTGYFLTDYDLSSDEDVYSSSVFSFPPITVDPPMPMINANEFYISLITTGSFDLGKAMFVAKGCMPGVPPRTCSAEGVVAQADPVTSEQTATFWFFMEFSKYNRGADTEPDDLPNREDVIDRSYTTLRSAIADYINVATNDVSKVYLVWEVAQYNIYGHAFGYLTAPLENVTPNITVTIDGIEVGEDIVVNDSLVEIPGEVLDKQLTPQGTGNEDEYSIKIVYSYAQTSTDPSLGDVDDPVCGYLGPEQLNLEGWNEMIRYMRPRFRVELAES